MTVAAKQLCHDWRRLAGCLLLFLLLLLLLLLLPACSSSRGPVFYLSFHQVPSDVEILNRKLYITLDSADGQTSQVIGKYPFFDSARIIQAEVVPDPASGRCGLKLYLDRQGVSAWREVTVYHRATTVVAAMDGFYVGQVHFASSDDEPGVLTTNALWSEYEARKIVEHVDANYDLGGRE